VIYQTDGHAHFYFVIIIMSVLGLSNIFDNINPRSTTIPNWVRLVGVLGITVFTSAVLLGLPHYADISTGPHTDLDVFDYDFNIVLGILAAGIFVEFAIACSVAPFRLPWMRP